MARTKKTRGNRRTQRTVRTLDCHWCSEKIVVDNFDWIVTGSKKPMHYKCFELFLNELNSVPSFEDL